jgi:hypothetical protein
MISDILKAYQGSGMPANNAKHTCKYCKRSFSKEITLQAHVCEKKRRYQQEKEKGVQWGFMAYLEFHRLTQNTKEKSYDDFAESPYYTSFVKFGRYCQSIRCINFISFTNWLLKNNKKLDYWVSDKLYEEWLLQYLRNENVQDALERSMKEITEYCEQQADLKNGYQDYFRYGNANRILHHISTGCVSPWLVYNCDSGVEFLGSLTEDQVAMIMPWINPDHWQLKFKHEPGDIGWARQILAAAGL